MIDINELRRLTQAATPGPWIGAGPSFGESLPKYLNGVVVDREGDEDDGYSICNAPIGLEEQCSDDMAFIGTANPAAISELLDRLEAAEKERDALRAENEAMKRQEPVAKVESWTNGSYTCHYKLKWLRDVDEGALLYALPGAQLAPSVPDGWKLVPIEPTQEMRDAWTSHPYSSFRVAYQAMLAAAPEAKCPDQ